MVIYSYVSLPEGIQNADAISQSDRPNPTTIEESGEDLEYVLNIALATTAKPGQTVIFPKVFLRRCQLVKTKKCPIMCLTKTKPGQYEPSCEILTMGYTKKNNPTAEPQVQD